MAENTQPVFATRSDDRSLLARAHRIVVKVGSSSLTSIQAGISDKALVDLSNALATRRNAGTEIVIVSSGAIAAGLAPLGLTKRPRDLATQQAAASVGQGLLMARYTQAFGVHGITVSQVLLTVDDLMRRSHHSNAFRASGRLLNLGVVPVVNENDTVATHKIRFGDNDRLSALVAHLVRADALLLLSDVDSLYDGPPAKGAKRISLVGGREDLDGVNIGKPGAAGTGTGGMRTKVEAANMASDSGIPALITSTANAADALAGSDVGTWFPANGERKSLRMLWLAHLAPMRGRLVVDDGAVVALRDQRRSLLPAGITAVEGSFEAEDAVQVVSPSGAIVAHGLVAYSSEELPQMLGRSTLDLRKRLGRGFDREVVHIDDLVLI